MYTVVWRLPKMSHCFFQSSLSFLGCNVMLLCLHIFTNWDALNCFQTLWDRMMFMIIDLFLMLLYILSSCPFLSTKLKDYRCHICKIFEKTELPERSVFPHTALHVEMITEVTLNVSILIHSYHLLSDVRKANDESLFLSQCKIILWVTFFARIL